MRYRTILLTPGRVTPAVATLLRQFNATAFRRVPAMMTTTLSFLLFHRGAFHRPTSGQRDAAATAHDRPKPRNDGREMIHRHGRAGATRACQSRENADAGFISTPRRSKYAATTTTKRRRPTRADEVAPDVIWHDDDAATSVGAHAVISPLTPASAF